MAIDVSPVKYSDSGQSSLLDKSCFAHTYLGSFERIWSEFDLLHFFVLIFLCKFYIIEHMFFPHLKGNVYPKDIYAHKMQFSFVFTAPTPATGNTLCKIA